MVGRVKIWTKIIKYWWYVFDNGIFFRLGLSVSVTISGVKTTWASLETETVFSYRS